MKFLSLFGKFFSTAGKQLNSSHGYWRYEPDKREIHFTNKCLKQMRLLGLNEAHALDVYYHGYVSEQGKMAKKYNGYEIGIFYMISNNTGRIIITWIWKRERR